MLVAMNYPWLRKRDVATARGVCPHCGKDFGPTNSGKQWYLPHFCSRKCARRSRMTAIPPVACVQCGRPFTPRSGEKRRRFCTKQCQHTWRNPVVKVRRRGGYPIIWTGKAEVLVHRIVMEEKLGRPLRDTETVHHINGDRMDWRIENLELWDHAQPHGQRVPDKLAWCVEYLTLHGYVVTPPGSK